MSARPGTLAGSVRIADGAARDGFQALRWDASWSVLDGVAGQRALALALISGFSIICPRIEMSTMCTRGPSATGLAHAMPCAAVIYLLPDERMEVHGRALPYVGR
jgi:hypothetical protein